MSVESLFVKIIDSNALSEQEHSEILELCSRAYQRDFKPFLDTFNDAIHILGRYQDILVTHALWVTRWLQCVELPTLRTAYVEAVATDERYRRQGFASAIMKRVAEETSQFDLGALCTGSPDFYARLGWQLWQGPLFIRAKEGLIATPNEQVMILFMPNTPVLNLDSPLSAEWREGELW